jgi:type I restriction enzyme S subunit
MKEYKLTDVCDFQGGTQPPKSEWINEPREGYVRMLQIRDFTQGKSQHIEYVKDNKKVNKCKEDDILIARYGASIGKIVTGLEGAYNVALIKTIPDENLLTKKYLQSILKSPIFQNFILSTGVRAAQAGFNKEDLSRFKLVLPSLNEQIRISEILTQAENLISQRKLSSDFLDELLKNTFLEMFGDPTKNHLGWEIKKLDSFISALVDVGSNGANDWVSKNIQMKDNEDYALMVRTGNLNNNDFSNNLKFVTKETYELFKKTKVYGGEIIMNKIGSAGDFWIMPNLNRPVSLGLNQLMFTLEKIDKIFFYYYYSTAFGRSLIKSKTRGAITKSITKTALRELEIYYPPIELQNQFATIVEKAEVLKKEYEASLRELENIYGVLSQKAFKGELNI